MSLTFSFSNKVFVLTGANGGIGRALAELFAKAGAHMILADRDLTPLEVFAATLPGAGRKLAAAMDAASPQSAQDLADLARDTFGRVDYIVPSAGVYLSEPFAQMSDEQWRRTLSVNLDGVFYLLSRLSPLLAEGSAIVNLTSLAAHRGAFSNAHYSASKGALTALTRSLSRELGPKTRVNAVAPGVIDTPMTRDLIATRGDSSIAQTPLARLGKPEEIASAIAFLCSDAASFITGETIHVNGGIYMA